MKAENFCFWLQGFFELADANSITPEQAEQIKTHLALVFKHDPAMAHKAPSETVDVPSIHRTPGRRSGRDTLFC